MPLWWVLLDILLVRKNLSAFTVFIQTTLQNRSACRQAKIWNHHLCYKINMQYVDMSFQHIASKTNWENKLSLDLWRMPKLPFQTQSSKNNLPATVVSPSLFHTQMHRHLSMLWSFQSMWLAEHNCSPFRPLCVGVWSAMETTSQPWSPTWAGCPWPAPTP